jgi:WS/DGAT/MGAT family acyltransferase
MAQEHLQRLTAVDASFLHQESASAHMHVGAVALLEGPSPARDDLLDVLRSRLHRVPRYRQKVAFPPAGAGRPLWVDDAAFEVEDHLRHTALPPPGSESELLDLAARIFSEPLDRSRPLWELWLVDGLAGGRFAIVSKTHHAVIDGVAGVELAQLLFDPGPLSGDVEHPAEPWRPAPEPTGSRLLAAGARGLARSTRRAATLAAGALGHPRGTLRSAGAAAAGVREVVRAALDPAPPSPLNVPIGADRRFAVVRADLSDVKLVKDAFGGTVNDVVLAVVTGALRTWMRDRGAGTDGLQLRALVPVSIRAEHERGAMGNRLAAMRGALPVDLDDPVARMREVREAMEGAKASGQAAGAKVLAGVGSIAPPAILAWAARQTTSTRLFNLIVTNVPGPQVPLYLRGRELLDVFPVAFLPRDHALAVAVFSYNGRMGFGLLGDHDALEDIHAIAEAIEASLDELVQLAATGAGR